MGCHANCDCNCHAEPRKRIDGCGHHPDRMREWIDEGACPICVTASMGIAQDRIKYLRNLLGKYGKHHPHCGMAEEGKGGMHVASRKCYCGLEDAVMGRDCEHHFESNPGLYDTSHRYCAKCGRAE